MSEPEAQAQQPAAEQNGKGAPDQGKPGTPTPENPKADKQANPLGEEQRGFNDAFWQGQRFLSPDMARFGPSAAIGRADIRDLQIGDRTQIFIGHTVSRTPGTVRDEALAWVRHRYLAVPGYQQLSGILTELRVLLLRGEPGTGRFTTALHLLDRVAQARIFRVDGKKTVTNPEWRDFPDKNGGYVAELSREDASSVTEEKLDKLRDVLTQQSAFCVLVSESDPRDPDTFGGYAATYTPPDPALLLRQHATHEVLEQDPPDLEQRLAALLDAGWAARALGPCPRPMESVRMAALLAQHARGAITREDVERQAAAAVRFQISEWFAPLRALPAGAEHDEALYLTAFRVALAVFNLSPYHLVAHAAGKLGSMLIEASADHKTRRASLFSDDPASRLPAIRAKLVDGFTMFGTARLPMQLLVFHDDRYPAEILRYVWENHHRMGTTITQWLGVLCTDVRPVVWVRAAQAVGFLGSLDFSEIYTKVIYPGVQSIAEEPPARWQPLAAAVALDQAAQHEHLRAAVRGRLRSWRRSGGIGERWVAAAAHGFILGRQHLAESLEELRILGTPAERQRPLQDGDEHALVWIAGFSIAKLFAFGEPEVVLDHLRRWIASPRSSLRCLAQSAMRELVDFSGFELDHLEFTIGREQPVVPERMKKWPLLLSVHVRNPELTESTAELLRQLLRREGDPVAKRVLGKWIRLSERDPELLSVLIDFLPHVIHDAGDEYRLTHLLNRLAQDWAEPLSVDVMRRVREAVLSIRVESSIA